MSKTVRKKPESTAEQEPVRESPATTVELNAAKSVFEPLLSDCVCRTGQFKNVRRMLMESGRYTPAAIACMTDEEACCSLQFYYAVVGLKDGSGDDIMLFARDRLGEFRSMVKYVSR